MKVKHLLSICLLISVYSSLLPSYYKIDKTKEIDKIVSSLDTYLRNYAKSYMDNYHLDNIIGFIWDKRNINEIDMSFVSIVAFFYIEKIKHNIDFKNQPLK